MAFVWIQPQNHFKLNEARLCLPCVVLYSMFLIIYYSTLCTLVRGCRAVGLVLQPSGATHTHTHTPDDVTLDQWGVVSCGDVTGAYRLITAALQYHKVAARLSLCASLCYVFDGGRSGGREAREGTRSFRDKKKKKKRNAPFSSAKIDK